jgi:hypothetical protein
MASLILGAAGAALGSSLFGAGFSFLGATITGAQIGGALGTIAGSMIDSAIAPGRHTSRTGPRLSDIQIQSSTEGAAIPRLYGRTRIAGQLIWATHFKETTTTNRETAGGKGLAPKTTVTETDYLYSVSFAVALCEGEITKIGRVWADGALIDLTQFTTRLYTGSEAQSPDPLIEDIEGPGNAPAYRGTAYIVLEDMPLASFGNRIPQLQFEVIRAISAADPSSLENKLPGICLIPGAGEFAYADTVITADNNEGTTTPENAHTASATADIDASLDELQSLAPNLSAVSLVVGWFGSDLRAAHCAIKPCVETAAKNTYPQSWSVDGIERDDAAVVGQVDGRPVYGGTPSDASVVAAIRNLKARGLSVLFNPFLFMDIASGNTLPDPHTGTTGQPPYPWRGRIACDPAPNVTGSPDKTSGAATQLASFFGTASATDFTVTGDTVAWSGGGEWSYRRMILHYAHLCAAAGGVDAFLIGSELVGLTRVRSDATTYPAVAALKTLAADVRAILGADTKIGYAADWSEYNNHQTGDAPGALLFNLDPLWSDTNIDFIGIDNYMPLADWRDGTAHADYDAAHGPTAIHDIDYLKSNIAGGEDYDWYYASDADRDTQTRTPITDGLGKPWVFRAKDIVNWWNNPHHDRADGAESPTPTDWVPQSKPIWFNEIGCPAIDKGANQPNVFLDPKSSESHIPYYSNGQRDDLIQRRFLEAHLGYWSDPANNPTSTEYAAPMLDTSHIYVWTWDARPFPAFPARSDVWGDAANYQYGHWLNGRLGAVQLGDLVSHLCEDAKMTGANAANLSGLVTGFAVTGTMSPRDAIAPLALAYHFDGLESEGVIAFEMRGRPTTTPLTTGDLALEDGTPGFGFTLTRAQETDLPLASRIAYSDADADYRQAMVEQRYLTGAATDRIATSALPIVMDQAQASGIGARLLQDAWQARETATFALPPSRLALDPADDVELTANDRTHRLRLTEVNDAGARRMRGEATDPSIYEPLTGPQRQPNATTSVAQFGRAVVTFLDLPLLTGREVPWAPHAAAFASPWPGAELVYRSAGEENFTLDTTLTSPATLGVTTADFARGPLWRWDRVNTLDVRLFNGTLTSASELAVLGGANALAVETDTGWEIVQFSTADLTAPDTWRLTNLLRGQLGTDADMMDTIPSGARVVLLDAALEQLHLGAAEATLPLNLRYGPQGKTIGDPAYQRASAQFKGIGQRPYAPAQQRAAWSGADLILTWTRRDRDPASDSWDVTEIPLSESSEAYDVDIFNEDGDVVRTFANVASSAITYTASMIAADFPSGPPSPLPFRATQLSTTFGRGA